MPRQLSAYDGITDTYINALAPTHNHTFIQGPNETFAGGLAIDRINFYGLTSLQRSCAISVFRSPLNETEAPFTFLRACFSVYGFFIDAEISKANSLAVRFFVLKGIVFVCVIGKKNHTSLFHLTFKLSSSLFCECL